MSIIVLGREEDVCQEYVLHSKRTTASDESRGARSRPLSGYKVSFPKALHRDTETESHPLMYRASKLVLNYPSMSSLLDSCLNRYLLDLCRIGDFDKSYPLLPKYRGRSTSRAATDDFEGLAKKDVFSMLESTRVRNIFNWISLVSLFLKDRHIYLEPFQKLLFMHSVFFMSSTGASEHAHLLDRVLSAYFDLDQSVWRSELENFKKQICAFVIARRQGKTFATVIFIAAAMLTMKDIRLAYVAHIRFQSNGVMRDVKKRMEEMSDLISKQDADFKSGFPTILSVHEQQAMGTITVAFADGSESVGKIASCRNKDVSIFGLFFF